MKLIRYIISTLTKDSVPVWMTLLLFLIGTVVTYFVAPLINEQFEIQAAKREFVVKNLDSFSSDTKAMVDLVGKALNETDQVSYNKIVVETAPVITKLHFSCTQLLFILPEEGDLVVSFQKSLESLQNELVSFRVGSDSESIVQNMKHLSQSSLMIYAALLRRAGLGSAGPIS